MKRLGTAVASAIACSLTGASAQAQWTAIRLHSAGLRASDVFAVSPTLQGGWVNIPQFPASHPVLWGGSAGFVDLTSSPTDGGSVRGILGDRQAGDLNGHASLWSGTAQSRVDLHPLSNPASSRAQGIAGNQQAGYVYLTTAPEPQHAGVWMGTASSFVDLHPAGARNSVATATDGEYQAGWAQLANFATHAAFWHGTAPSFVDLTPDPNWESWINGMAPGQQVGWVNRPVPGGSADHAALWSGSAASFVDLNPYGPASFRVSQLLGTCGLAQVGSANVIGFGNVAGIWFGTAESFVNLGQFLPPGYGESQATSVAFENGVFYVGGFAFSNTTGQHEAFLWTGVPAPGGFTLMAAATLLLPRRRR